MGYVSAESKRASFVSFRVVMDAVSKLSVFGIAVFERRGMGRVISRDLVTCFSTDGGAHSRAGGWEIVEAVGVIVGEASIEALCLGEGVLLLG